MKRQIKAEIDWLVWNNHGLSRSFNCKQQGFQSFREPLSVEDTNKRIRKEAISNSRKIRPTHLNDNQKTAIRGTVSPKSQYNPKRISSSFDSDLNTDRQSNGDMQWRTEVTTNQSGCWFRDPWLQSRTCRYWAYTKRASVVLCKRGTRRRRRNSSSPFLHTEERIKLCLSNSTYWSDPISIELQGAEPRKRRVARNKVNLPKWLPQYTFPEAPIQRPHRLRKLKRFTIGGTFKIEKWHAHSHKSELIPINIGTASWEFAIRAHHSKRCKYSR